MLYWILEAIAAFIAIIMGCNMGETIAGMIGFSVVFFLIFTICSSLIIGILSECIPAKSARIKSRERLEVERIDTAYVYLTDGEAIPLEMFSKIRPTQNETYVELIDFCEGGWKGYWLWDTNFYMPEFILYVRKG